jgi:DNA-binding IclR family transcriptional regulator
VAAPIRDYTGRIIAGISVSGPVTRMTDAHIEKNLPVLLDSARQVSARLGWQPEA